MTGDKHNFQAALDIAEFGDQPQQKARDWQALLSGITAPNDATFRVETARREIGRSLPGLFRGVRIDASRQSQFESQVAYVLARATDEYFGNYLFDVREIIERFVSPDNAVKSGKLIPIRRDDSLRAHLQKNLPPRNISIDGDPTLLWHCRLAPVMANGDPKLVICSRHYHAIGKALYSDRERLVFGVGIPVWSDEQKCDKLNLRNTNFIVRQFPEPPDLWQRLQRIIAKAIEMKVDVLVFPELTVSDIEQQKLVDLLGGKSPAAMRMLVAGSAHRFEAPGSNATFHEQQNVTRLALRGAGFDQMPREVRHVKFQNYKGSAVDRKTGNFNGMELLFPTPKKQVTCYVGAQVSLVVLCCKDFLETQVVKLLDTIQPSHVIVPALSPKMAPFRSNATRLAVGAQSRVIVANGFIPNGTSHPSAGRNGIAALFGVPNGYLAEQASGLVVAQLGTGTLPPPALCVIEDLTEKYAWYPV